MSSGVQASAVRKREHSSKLTTVDECSMASTRRPTVSPCWLHTSAGLTGDGGGCQDANLVSRVEGMHGHARIDCVHETPDLRCCENTTTNVIAGSLLKTTKDFTYPTHTLTVDPGSQPVIELWSLSPSRSWHEDWRILVQRSTLT